MIVPNMLELNPGSDKPVQIDLVGLPEGITIVSAGLAIKNALSDPDNLALTIVPGNVVNQALYEKASIVFVLPASFTSGLTPGASYFWTAKTQWSSGLQVTPEGCYGPVYVRAPGIVGPV